MPSPGQTRPSQNNRQPPRRLSLVDLRAAERSEGSPAIDSGFVYSEGHPRTFDSPARSPSSVSGTRFNALQSPLLPSPSYRSSRSPTFPSTPVSPAPSYSARRSNSIQQLARASRQVPHAAGSESFSTDYHDLGDDQAGRSSFAYTRSTSWYSNAPLSHTTSSYAEETRTSPPAMLSPSTSHGSLRGVGRRFPYTHTRGKSDSTNSRSPMTKTSVWTSSPATSTVNVEFMEPSSSRESSAAVRRQKSRGPGMTISRSSGSLRTAMLAYKTPEIDGRTATGILENEDPSSPEHQYASALTSVAASPEALQNEASSVFDSANQRTLSRSESGRKRNTASRHGLSSYSSWSELPAPSEGGTRSAGGWHHPDVPRSPSSTPTSQMVRLDSFATGRESFTTEESSRYDEPVQPMSEQISSTGWHPGVENSPALETLVEDASVLSDSGGVTIRNASNTRKVDSRGDRQASPSEQRPQSASSSSSATSVPMGFGQSLRNYFADYLMYPGLTRAQPPSVDNRPTDEQEWLSQPSRSTPSEASTGGNGRASSRGTTGADQTDRAVNDRDDFENWRRHQGSSSLASGILPFPTDAIPEDGDDGQRIHRADREYLSALGSSTTAQFNRARLMPGRHGDTKPVVEPFARRQRSSDPLLPVSHSVSKETTDQVVPMANAEVRSKRWSDVVRATVSTRGLFSDEPLIDRSAGSYALDKEALPCSGRSSGASKHSMHRLVAGPANKRFKRTSAEIDTRDDSPPLSFFGGLQNRSRQPCSNPRESDVQNGSDHADPVLRNKKQQSSRIEAPEPSSTIELERLASHEHHHRLTSETLRQMEPDALPLIEQGVSPLALAKQMRLDLHGQDPQSRLLRVMFRSKLLRVLWSALCPALLIIVPACWYVFEGGYLYHALSPAVLFPPMIPLLGAWTSYLGIWLADPGYVEPARAQNAEQQPPTPQNLTTPAEQGEDEDPAIAALDKDSPKRRMALEKLREQLLKAVAPPLEINEKPQQPGQQTDLEAARVPASADTSNLAGATSHRGTSADEPHTPMRRYPSIATTHLSFTAGPSAPPTSPVTVKPSKRSLRLAQDSQMTLRQQSHPELKSKANLSTSGAEDGMKLPKSGETLAAGTFARPGASDKQQTAFGGPDLESALASLWPHNARRLPRRAVQLQGQDQPAQEVSVAWCEECRIFPPPRSVHVHGARRCVEGFQYFSYTIGRSIGQGNVIFMVALLFFSAIFLLYVLAFSIWMLVALSQWDSHHSTSPPGIVFTSGPWSSFQDALQAVPFAAILFLASAIILGTCLIPCLARQLYASSQAQTIPQCRLAKAISRKLRSKKCPESLIQEAIYNPFDTRSWRKNLRQELWTPSHNCHHRFRRPVATSVATLHAGRDEEAALPGHRDTIGTSVPT